MRSRRRAVEERLFSDFVASVRVRAMFLLDADGHVVSWNAGAAGIHGYASAAIVGQPFSVFYPPEAASAGVPAGQLAAAREAQSVEDEGWRLREDGSRFWANVVITALCSGDGELGGFGIIVRDLTGRHRSSQFLQSVLDHTADAFVGIDTGGFILSFNRAAERIFGYTEAEALGVGIDEIVPGALQYPRDGVGREVGGRRRDGTALPVDVTLTPFDLHGQSYFMCVCRDLTERKRDEERLKHAQQMQAMGQLASGVAHDFNNLLTAVAGYCEAVKKSLEAGDVRQEAVEQIAMAAEKAASLTQQLLAFARQRPSEPKVLDLHVAIPETTRLLQRTLSENIVLTTVARGAFQPRADRRGVRQPNPVEPGGQRPRCDVPGRSSDCGDERRRARP
jgi:two-component system sensor kinase FixL